MQRALARLALFAVMLAAPAAGAGTLKPGIFGPDNRIAMDNRGGSLAAIGQVNIGGYRRLGMCSGTLVAPRIVLTAAHCVLDPFTRKPFRAENIHFLAGVRKDESLGHSVADCVKLPDDYVWAGSPDYRIDLPADKSLDRDISRDIALIVLKNDLPEAPVIPVASALENGSPVIMAGYPADRRFQLMGDATCHLLSHSGQVALTDCDVHFGSSGGPLLVDEDGGLKTAGVLSGFIAGKGSIAILASSWKNLPLDPACP